MSSLKHLSFFKIKLVLCSIKVRSHCNFLKPFPVYVAKIIEGHVKKSFLAIAGLLFTYVAVRQWLEIPINVFLIKKVLAVGGWWWVLVDIFWLVVGGGGYILTRGGWWWIYLGWWWVVVGYVLAGGGWWHSLV